MGMLPEYIDCGDYDEDETAEDVVHTEWLNYLDLLTDLWSIAEDHDDWEYTIDDVNSFPYKLDDERRAKAVALATKLLEK